MSLVGMLMGRLRMLLRSIGLLLALGMIALAVMFGGGAMSLGRVLVVFGCFIMFVSGHILPPGLFAPSRHQIAKANFGSTDRRADWSRRRNPPLEALSCFASVTLRELAYFARRFQWFGTWNRLANGRTDVQ
jgi:hypothetical protein